MKMNKWDTMPNQENYIGSIDYISLYNDDGMLTIGIDYRTQNGGYDDGPYCDTDLNYWEVKELHRVLLDWLLKHPNRAKDKIPNLADASRSDVE